MELTSNASYNHRVCRGIFLAFEYMLPDSNKLIAQYPEQFCIKGLFEKNLTVNVQEILLPLLAYTLTNTGDLMT